MTSQPFSCVQCGAPLAIPEDPQAMAVVCAYCKRQNALPQHVLYERQQRMQQVQAYAQAQQAAKTGRRVAGWVMVLTVLPILIGVAVPLYIVFRTTSAVETAFTEAATAVRTPEPERAPTPEPTAKPAVAAKPVKPPRDVAAIEARMTALMKDRYNAGCTRVLMAPTKAHGHSGSKATLSKNAFCMVLIAVSGGDDAKITLSMKNPLGEAVPGPAPAKELVFPFCSKVDGEHQIAMDVPDDEPFMLGSVDCPASVANAMLSGKKK